MDFTWYIGGPYFLHLSSNLLYLILQGLKVMDLIELALNYYYLHFRILFFFFADIFWLCYRKIPIYSRRRCSTLNVTRALELYIFLHGVKRSRKFDFSTSGETKLENDIDDMKFVSGDISRRNKIYTSRSGYFIELLYRNIIILWNILNEFCWSEKNFSYDFFCSSYGQEDKIIFLWKWVSRLNRKRNLRSLAACGLFMIGNGRGSLDQFWRITFSWCSELFANVLINSAITCQN